MAKKRQVPKKGFRPPVHRLDPRSLLRELHRERQEHERLEARAVRQLREQGATWREIADLTGMKSRQAAYARFGKDHPPTKPTTPQS